MFYNPMEQLVPEQFSAEPPFGGSNILNAPLFNTPYMIAVGSIPSRILSTASSPHLRTGSRLATFPASSLYGQFQPHLRTQYSVQYNLNLQQ